MALLSQLRYPTKWYAKVLAAALALVFFAVLTTMTTSAFLLYRILSPVQRRADIDTRAFPGHPDTVTFTVPGVGSREGWFFPGLKTAPTIILCHGYQSNRGELLTLVSALQDNQFNVFLFDFVAHGSSPGLSSLGFRETQELRAAVAAVAQRSDIDHARFGVWGANLGGYVAVSAALSDPRVRALAVESVYDDPEEMARVLILHSGPSSLPLMQRMALFAFKWVNYSYRHELPLSKRIGGLGGVAKLFIQANDEPILAASTRELFLQAPEPREQHILAKGNYAAMLDEEKRHYENTIVSFFLSNLPPSSRPSR
jgi:pimeloyl-ACP methyl ester carboxylesterase